MKTRFWMTFAALSLALVADPFVGTWKPEVEKWKLSPGAPERRKQEVITLEPVGKDKYRETITRLDSKPSGERPVILNVDGKAHDTDFGTAKVERIDDRHLRTSVKGPKGNAVIDWTVSADGKTLTMTRTGTGAYRTLAQCDSAVTPRDGCVKLNRAYAENSTSAT